MDQKQAQAVQLPPNDLFGFDYVSTRFDAMVQKGVTPAHLEEPAFWAHHGMKLKPMDEIRVRAEDGTWVAYAIVLDCSRTWARVKILALHQLGTADVALTQASTEEVKAFIAGHKVVHRGMHKWSVVRESDRSVLAQGIERKEDAQAELERLAKVSVGGAAAQQPKAAVATA